MIVAAPLTDQHRYRLSGRSPRYLMTFLLALVLSDVVLSVMQAITGVNFHIARVTLTAGLAVAWWIWFSTTLVISPTGLSYRAAGLRDEARWEDVIAIGRVLPLGSEGLIIWREREPSWWEQKRRFVPLEYFASDWRTSALGDDIRQYVPWLIEGR